MFQLNGMAKSGGVKKSGEPSGIDFLETGFKFNKNCAGLSDSETYTECVMRCLIRKYLPVLKIAASTKIVENFKISSDHLRSGENLLLYSLY